MSHRAPLPSAGAAAPGTSPASVGRDLLYDVVTRFPVPNILSALLGIYLLGTASVLLAPPGSKVAVWWPAAGVSVALLVLAPRRLRLLLTAGIVVSSGLANLSAGREPDSALGLGLSNAAEAFLVAWWLTRRQEPGERPTLRSMEDLWLLVGATIAGPLVAGFGIGLTVALTMDGSFLVTMRAITASHAAAILAFTPLVLALDSSPLSGRRLEAVLQWIVLVAAVVYTFGPDQRASLTFVPLPLLLWAALRFGVRTVAYQLVAIGLVSSLLTAAGAGPFAVSDRTGVSDPATTASLVQLFLLTTALVALPLAVAIQQRGAAMERVVESEELFRKTFSESFVGMLLLYRSPEGLRIRDANPTAARILGGTPDELVGQRWAPLLDTDADFEAVADRMLAGEVQGWREEMWLTHDPNRRVGAALSTLSTSGQGTLFSAQLLDITEIHDAAQRLRTEKDFTAAVLGTTACLIVVVSDDGRVAGLNPAAERASGYTEAEVLDEPLWGSLFAPDDERRMRGMFATPTPGAEPPRYEGDLVTSTGRRRRVVWSSAPLTDDAGHRTHVVMTGIDVTEERTVRSMINHLLDAASATAFIGVNLRGTISIFNSGAEQMLGYRSADVVDRVRLDMLHDPDELAQRRAEVGARDGFLAIVDGAAEAPVTRDWTYVTSDGQRVVAAVTMSTVRDAFGAHIGYLAVGRDVTEARRSQRILVETLEKEREAVERLQELDRAKNDFVSTVSHELRTPITSIVGYTEMLQDGAAGAISPEQDRLLDAVRRNGERLISLIEDLLTLSRIEAGTFSMQRRQLDLRAVVTRSHEALRPMLTGRRLDVSFDVPTEPVPVVGDAAQLERVVLNLVGNAVKFTEDGGRVRCTLTVSRTHAELEITDTGMGIPADEQGALFTRFFRSTTAQERAIQGTGLGLSIVQSIVESHGGSVTLRSEHRVGTEVHVELPLTLVEQPVPEGRRILE